MVLIFQMQNQASNPSQESHVSIYEVLETNTRHSVKVKIYSMDYNNRNCLDTFLHHMLTFA